jgi:polyribonucleotide nucleotidyltransferase
MVEGGANFVKESDIVEAIMFGHRSLQPLIKMQHDLHALASNPKETVEPPKSVEELVAQIDLVERRVSQVVRIADRNTPPRQECADDTLTACNTTGDGNPSTQSEDVVSSH